MDLEGAKSNKAISEKIEQAMALKVYPDPDWADKRDNVMFQAMLLKFTQSARLAKVLLNTSSYKLATQTGTDSYWGHGLRGEGANKLWEILRAIKKHIWNGLISKTLVFPKFSMKQNQFLNTEAFQPYMQLTSSGVASAQPFVMA